ncbi:MAG: general L-amino acid transport system permease protein [Candidatus Tokpelaia sp. JSC161]|jgi:general L-amino acid transport system permease protein|nr:MAG: general L-amino acid transport system permease protein [Candidatus Tokpelaia sp. JSC161]
MDIKDMEEQSSYIRKNIAPSEPMLRTSRQSTYHWLYTHLFASPINALITLLLATLIIYIAKHLGKWVVLDAIWEGKDRTVCATKIQGGIQNNDWSGACWAFVKANYTQIIYGFYPPEHRWRVNLTGIIAITVNITFLMPSIPYKFINGFISLIIIPIFSWYLLHGGYLSLPLIDTQLWGGLMVTLTIAYISISISFIIGTLLALGRRSQISILRLLCILFIETLRGIPLVSILFIASIMFPLFIPHEITFDKLLRALIGIAIFTSVYIAEAIRGGLQAIPKSQYEAATSLGLKYTTIMCLIILPQAYRLVIPAIINILIGMLKETSLIYIVSMFDLLGMIRITSIQANWITPQTPATAFVTVAFVYWVLCFMMSRYAYFIEKRINLFKQPMIRSKNR